MTGYNKVFLDTAPLIYFLDDDVNFGQKAKSVFEEILSNGKTIVSSAITCHEYLAKIAETAAKIRAEYHDFKAMDSLQLAVAAETGCDVFLTNDKQLKQYKGMNCITLEEWIL